MKEQPMVMASKQTANPNTALHSMEADAYEKIHMHARIKFNLQEFIYGFFISMQGLLPSSDVICCGEAKQRQSSTTARKLLNSAQRKLHE